MKVLYFVAAVSMLALTGCAGSGPNVSGGMIFTSVKGPVTATPTPKASKEGTACATNILGVAAFGDNSVNTAKNSGDIKRVSSVDYNRFSILGVVYEKVCTVVKGN